MYATCYFAICDNRTDKQSVRFQTKKKENKVSQEKETLFSFFINIIYLTTHPSVSLRNALLTISSNLSFFACCDDLIYRFVTLISL